MSVLVTIAEPGREHVRRRAVRDAEVELARIGLGVGDQVGHGLGGNLRAARSSRRARSRRSAIGANDFADRSRHSGRARDRSRASPRCRPAACSRRAPRSRRRVGGERAAGARAVVDDHLLAERRRQVLCDQSAHHVDRPAGRERHQQPDRARGIFVLRLRRRRTSPARAAMSDDENAPRRASQRRILPLETAFGALRQRPPAGSRIRAICE